MKYIPHVFALFLAFGIAVPAFAATFGSSEFFSLDDGITINDDAYVAGGTATVASDIEGDLTIAGGRVTVTGSVANDVLAAGGDVSIHGDVADDIRIAGGDVTIAGTVGDDVVVAGGTVHILPGASVAGDVYAAAGEVIIAGDIAGDVRARGGLIRITGHVGGTVSIPSAERVMFGDTATVVGDVTYHAPTEADIADGADIQGAISYTEVSKGHAQTIVPMLTAVLGMFFLGKVVVSIIAALALFYLFRRFSTDFADTALTHFGIGSVVGLATLAAVPVLVVLLLVSVLGIGLGLLLAVGYVFLLILAKVYAGILAGATLSRFTRGEVQVTWLWIVTGVIAIEVTSLIPVVGWVIGLIFFLAALGAIVRTAYTHVWQNR